jgi:hypothetical protein
MYECHITVNTKDAEVATEVAHGAGWHTSQIARDPVLGEDTHFYLTAHGTEYPRLYDRMAAVRQTLKLRGVFVLREKIEHIIHDVRNYLQSG